MMILTILHVRGGLTFVHIVHNNKIIKAYHKTNTNTMTGTMGGDNVLNCNAAQQQSGPCGQKVARVDKPKCMKECVQRTICPGGDEEGMAEKDFGSP